MVDSSQVPPPPTSSSPAEPPPPGVVRVPWGVLDAVGVFVVAIVLALLLGGLLGTIPGTERLPDGLVEALFLPLSLAILGITALLWVRTRYPGNVGRLTGPQRVTAREVLIALGLGLLAYLVINVGLGALLQLLAELTGEELPTVQEEFREAARNRRMAPYFAVGAVVFAPIAEELFFRGMLFPAIAKRLGLWAGIVLSAAAFSVAHLNQAAGSGANLLIFVIIFPLGMFLAWLYHWRGTIVVTMLVHSVFNLIGVILLLAGID